MPPTRLVTTIDTLCLLVPSLRILNGKHRLGVIKMQGIGEMNFDS